MIRNATISLVVIDSTHSTDVLAQSLNTDYFQVLATLDNGLSGLSRTLELKPDVLVLDVLLCGCDGYHVIDEVHRALPDTKILVVSGLSQDAFVRRALDLGADYYLLKPTSADNFEERILDLVTPVKITALPIHTPTKMIDERISNIFITVGIPAHIKGYQFLREAIKISMFNPDAISRITKFLYPSIATKFDTSASKVERAIRHAIEVAWNRGRIENINAIFGIKVYSGADKPTNGEFIALIADKMMIENAS